MEFLVYLTCTFIEFPLKYSMITPPTSIKNFYLVKSLKVFCYLAEIVKYYYLGVQDASLKLIRSYLSIMKRIKVIPSQGAEQTYSLLLLLIFHEITY